MTFLFSLVFDYDKQMLVPLNDPADSIYGDILDQYQSDLSFLGEEIEPKLAQLICNGKFDGKTLKEVDFSDLKALKEENEFDFDLFKREEFREIIQKVRAQRAEAQIQADKFEKKSTSNSESEPEIK